MKPPQMWGCVPHEPKRGVIDWKTKLVLDWQVDPDGYRIERRKSRHKLYVVANGGEPRRYTAYAWEDDILFELANIAAPPFPWSKWEKERASDTLVHPFSTIADEVFAAPDGVVIERVLAFAKQWGLLGQSHVEQPLADILGQAVQVRECFELKEGGRLFIVAMERARVSPQFDEQGRPYLLATASTIADFYSLEFMEYARTSGSYYCCANPKCGKYGPGTKALYQKVGGRPRKYCKEACEKVHSRLKKAARRA